MHDSVKLGDAMRVTVRNLSMEYRAQGKGQAVLFIHGYPLNSALWQPQLEGLADIAYMIAPDLRGHGRSEPLPPPYSMEMLADDCCALLDALGIQQAVIVCGLSMGGYVTFAFYRKYAARVAGLILAATRAGVDSPEGRANRLAAIERARDPAQGPAAVIEAMLPKMLAPQAYRNRPDLVNQVRAIMQSTSVEGIIGDQMGMLERADAIPLLAQIDRPVLVVHGADDQLIPVTEAQAMHAAIKTSRLQIIDGAGHLVNLEQPAQFNAAVRAFIDQFDLEPAA